MSHVTDRPPANVRLARALKDAGYGDDKAIRAFARKLAPIRGSTVDAARRAVYRWKRDEKPSYIDRATSAHLAEALDLDDPDAFYDPNGPTTLEIIMDALDDIREVVGRNRELLEAMPESPLLGPLLKLLATDPTALPPSLLREVADAQEAASEEARRRVAELRALADRLDAPLAAGDG